MQQAIHRRACLATLALWGLGAPAQADPGSAISARPFPWKQGYAPGVIQPSHITPQAMDQVVLAHYAQWQRSYLRDDGGQGTWVNYGRKPATVSEAHGYGMVLTALMGEQALFDEMLRYFLAHPSIHAGHLMAWKQVLRAGRMVDVQGPDSATDGDMDIAYALLLADRQWGSAGLNDYRGLALSVLQDILDHEVHPRLHSLTPGDWAQGADARHTRPSDFMVSHLLVFASADQRNAARWRKVHATVVRAVQDQLDQGSGSTGLMPDFMHHTEGRWVPVPGQYLETPHDGDYSYNACRTPWRLSMAGIVQGRGELLAAQQLLARWIRTQTGGDPAAIRAGYWVLNGPNGQPFVRYGDLAFLAPFAVNAMLGGPDGQDWLNRLWDAMDGGLYPPVVDYYGDTLRLMALLALSGNWWLP